jgi:hypothetical protein
MTRAQAPPQLGEGLAGVGKAFQDVGEHDAVEIRSWKFVRHDVDIACIDVVEDFAGL